MIKYLLFDWGDTIMRDDLNKPGPMVFWDEVSWIPGLRDVLHANLAINYQCVVASNSGESDTPLMIKALERIFAEEYFFDYFTSSDIGFEKPHPNFFNYILQKLNCTANECIMIGNNYTKDIEGAKNVGIFTIWFNEENKIKIDSPKADKTIFHMSELARAIEDISKLITNHQ